MTTVLLVRHGLSSANTGGTLAGWTPGVHLAPKGEEQVRALASRLAAVPIKAIVSSPLERCQETAAALLAGRDKLAIETDERLGECRYGDWEGQSLKTLAKDPLWKVVQSHPSAAQFPGGEALRDTQARAVTAVREHNARLGDNTTWVAVSHGDVIKAVLADALGLHLDEFQRIVVDPASVSVVTYTELRPFVVRMNDVGGDVAGLIPPKPTRRKRSSDAAVGGGAGGGR
ncbi:MAG TPA: histidine phosphatase family protein [Mycobacteriales bacterium]|nr:histidine phosphatase family protein [Mycobacteriales bacterium]